ncbi:hypothetical protein GCM10007857_82720 [Bradyrhizobium iriomotense]|uniref:Uncharacterized protein n=1 Tax=Bradyrhizobium iriomotense TaxID=441950 RepID=A0ABQ6BB02_9BRAD|nr:hypothetical protein GCM10007857_82720 [Bradyrhizobium iriomotense]
MEGGLRIPALVFWPARILAGLVSQQVTANMDWLPTLLAATGAAQDPATDSCSATTWALFDHLVSAGEQRRRQAQAELPCCFLIDDQLEFGWDLNWQFGWLAPRNIRSM